LELTISQQFSIPVEDNYRLKDPFGRFFLSFFLLLPFVLVFPRPVILGTLVISLLFQWGTLYYCSYFGSVPEIMVLLNNAAETAEVGDAVWVMIPWHLLLFLVPVLILQIFLLYRYTPPKLFYCRRLAWALCFVAAFCTLFETLNVLASKSPGRSSTGSRCAKFGFLPVFAHDIIFRYTRVDTLKEQALANEAQRSFGLQSEYQDFCFGDIVVLQVESLDNAVIDYQVNGKPVVPFLNSLQTNSLMYRIWANHRYGSATADYEMLTGVPPLDGFFNYKVPDLPYNTSLARFLGKYDYETFCFHGVTGTFYNRRPAFEKMTFDHIFFRQDIINAVRNGTYPLQKDFSKEQLDDYLDDNWLQDDVVLKTVLKAIQSPSERNRFFFVITVTSHVPWSTARIDNKNKLIPDETSIQDRYLNSIHYVDGLLRSFYEELPSGTLLILYGDHTPQFRSGTFVSDLEGSREFVPCFIHLVGNDIGELQRVPHRPKDQILSVRDVHSFLRDITERDAILSQRDAHEEEQKAATATPDVY
jgi:phosphoglycerol transferase MdoB-like AlkP superfamily enzyme